MVYAKQINENKLFLGSVFQLDLALQDQKKRNANKVERKEWKKQVEKYI